MKTITVNKWDETPEQYQKWLLRNTRDWLAAERWTLGQRVVMAYLFSTIEHSYDHNPKQFWEEDYGKGGELDYDPNYKYHMFKQSALAEELGMSNKGMREILECLAETDHYVQRHPTKYNWWIFNCEGVVRGLER